MSDTIIIVEDIRDIAVIEDSGDSTVIVQEVEQIVHVVLEVEQGVPGPPGASGAGFVHTQSSAATEWIVNHNLGFWPVVEFQSVGGIVGQPDVVHFSTNQVRLYFASVTAGVARCV